MSIRSLFRRRCTIERATTSVDADGGVSLTWSTAASDVPCALQPRSVQSDLGPAGEALVAEARLFVPADTDLRPALADGHADRVTVDGVRYRVTAVEDDGAGTEALRVATLVRVIA